LFASPKHISHASPDVGFAGAAAHSSVAHAIWQGAAQASGVPPEELPLPPPPLELPLLVPPPPLLPPLPPSGVPLDGELFEQPPA
jgi:hypothetical protein